MSHRFSHEVDTMTLIEQLIERSQSGIAAVAENTPVKAYAWARVSTETQAEKDNSIPQQLKEIREYAERYDYEIVQEFHEAISAFQDQSKRHEFNRMIELAKSDKNVGAIIVHDLSRFSRDSIEGRQVIRQLNARGVILKSVRDPDIDPDSDGAVYMEAISFAQHEAFSRKLGKDVLRGCKANVHKRDPKTNFCYKNGGKPMWGYKATLVDAGIGKGNRPVQKVIWELDDTIVSGRPVHEWTRYVLVELAGKGASLKEIRNFLNEKAVPGRGDKYWSSSSFKDMLCDFGLLKYAGHYLWNVRGKRTKRQNPEYWEIVEDAHPAIISEEEVSLILDVRREQRRKYPQFGKTRGSNYLLTGGLFICDRCGKNMIGHKNASGIYYVCGSQPYRNGMGCGNGVYVSAQLVESELMSSIKDLLGKFSDPKGFTERVNRKLKQIWEETSGYDPNAEKRISEIDRKIRNIRQGIEDGYSEVQWANQRLNTLNAEREESTNRFKPRSGPIRIDAKTAMELRSDIERSFRETSPEERKLYVKHWLNGISLLPDERMVIISLKVPDFIVKNGGAACVAQ
jgi:DNA invertase Pin-like site-specific DNA recombinase